MVIGLRQYVKAVGAQAIRFREMADRVERMMADDDQRFVAHYAQIKKSAIERTQMVLDADEVRRRYQDQQTKDQDVVNQRTTQLNDLKALFTKVRTEVNDLLAKQSLTEAQLFAIEREVGLTLEEIYKLEADLEKKERERYAPKK